MRHNNYQIFARDSLAQVSLTILIRYRAPLTEFVSRRTSIVATITDRKTGGVEVQPFKSFEVIYLASHLISF